MLRAAAKGNLKMVQTLLRYSASTNIQDTEGNTPLHLACSERLEESKLLVSQGASIDLENKEGKTPLQPGPDTPEDGGRLGSWHFFSPGVLLSQ